MKRRTLDVIRVFRAPGCGRRGLLRAGQVVVPCALGSGGLTRRKREGDGGTPVARLSVLGLRYRPDRIGRPRTFVPITAARPDHGWCDDPRDPAYNRPVRLPYSASHERMWRDDHLYDVVLDLGWNRAPVIKGRGSAIFLHLARPGLSPTEGCIAIERRWMARLAGWIGRRTVLEVRG